jgi:hypothetical protein
MADLRDVLEWLRLHIPHVRNLFDHTILTVTQEYRDPQRVYADVSGILQQNPFIHPRTKIFGIVVRSSLVNEQYMKMDNQNYCFV